MVITLLSPAACTDCFDWGWLQFLSFVCDSSSLALSGLVGFGVTAAWKGKGNKWHYTRKAVAVHTVLPSESWTEKNKNNIKIKAEEIKLYCIKARNELDKIKSEGIRW